MIKLKLKSYFIEMKKSCTHLKALKNNQTQNIPFDLMNNNCERSISAG